MTPPIIGAMDSEKREVLQICVKLDNETNQTVRAVAYSAM